MTDCETNFETSKWTSGWPHRDSAYFHIRSLQFSPGWVRRQACSLQTGWPGPPQCSHSSSSWLYTSRYNKEIGKETLVTFHTLYLHNLPSWEQTQNKQLWQGNVMCRRARFCLTHLQRAERAVGKSRHIGTSRRRPRRQLASSLSGWTRWLCVSQLEPRET